MTLFTIIVSMVLSCGRILGLNHYYHAPFDVLFHLETIELPRLLNVTDLLPPPEPRRRNDNLAYADDRHVDLSPIKMFDLRMCYGKEWYRFPGHYLVPDGVEVKFVKSDFDGLLPRHFEPSTGSEGLWKREQTRIAPPGLNDMNKEEKGVYVGSSLFHIGAVGC
jgi:alpha-1,2-mannosyltransferase